MCKVREEPIIKRLDKNRISVISRSHLSSWKIAYDAKDNAFKLYGFKEGDEFNGLISGLNLKISAKDQALQHAKLYLSLVSNEGDLSVITSRPDLLKQIRRMQPATISPAMKKMLNNKNRYSHRWTPITAIVPEGFDVSIYVLSRIGIELRLQQQSIHVSPNGATEFEYPGKDVDVFGDAKASQRTSRLSRTFVRKWQRDIDSDENGF